MLYVRPDGSHVKVLAAIEDHIVHNPFTAVGWIKPRPFCNLTVRVVLVLLNDGTRRMCAPDPSPESRPFTSPNGLSLTTDVASSRVMVAQKS